MKGKTVYVCSPYAGDVVANKEFAREKTKKVIEQGGYPITPHLYVTEVLDDRVLTERETGLHVGLKLLEKCDILCVFQEKGISSGMQREIDYVRQNFKEIEIRYEI